MRADGHCATKSVCRSGWCQLNGGEPSPNANVSPFEGRVKKKERVGFGDAWDHLNSDPNYSPAHPTPLGQIVVEPTQMSRTIVEKKFDSVAT